MGWTMAGSNYTSGGTNESWVDSSVSATKAMDSKSSQVLIAQNTFFKSPAFSLKLAKGHPL